MDKSLKDYNDKKESEMKNIENRNLIDETKEDQVVILSRSMFCNDLLEKVPNKEKNLIFFLTLTPAGISKTEAEKLKPYTKSSSVSNLKS